MANFQLLTSIPATEPLAADASRLWPVGGGRRDGLPLRADHAPTDAQKRQLPLHRALEGARDLRHQVGEALLDFRRRGASGVIRGPDHDRTLGLDGIGRHPRRAFRRAVEIEARPTRGAECDHGRDTWVAGYDLQRRTG